MDIFQEFILFDTSRPAPSFSVICIYACGIIILSQVIFMVLLKIMKISNVNDSLDKEKVKEYEDWKKKGISPWFVLVSDVINSTVYGPVAEELFFRVLLMKFICVKYFKISPGIANIIQSVIFGTMHVTNGVFSIQTQKYSNIQALSAGISGLVSGYGYSSSNSIFSPLLAHMLNNLIASGSEIWGYHQYLKNN